MGNSNEFIKFKKINAVKTVYIYHKRSYKNLYETFDFILDYVNKNNLTIINNPREKYIDGMWNKDSEEDYLTEIQITIE